MGMHNVHAVLNNVAQCPITQGQTKTKPKYFMASVGFYSCEKHIFQ